VYPWEAAAAAWVGWVPTVSGHLSFSLIGANDGARDHCRINEERPRPGHRIVVVHQRRRNTDFGYWSRLAELLLRDTVQDLVLVGQTEAAARPAPDPINARVEGILDPRGCLRGTIYVIPYNDIDERRAALKQTTRELSARSREIIALHEQEAVGHEVEQIERWARRQFDDLAADYVDEAGVHHPQAVTFEFALYRTGEFRIWHMSEAPDVAHLDKLAEQVFYFVKAIAHTHSHHGEEADQMVQLARLRPTQNSPEQCETAWRNETQWDLSRVFEQLHRHNGLDAQRGALGVLAYADAFQASLSQVLRVPGTNDTFAFDPAVAQYDNTHRRESVQALIENHTNEAANRIQLYVLASTTLFATIALWAAFADIRGDMCKDETLCLPLVAPSSSFAVSLIVNSPLTFFTACMLVVLASFLRFTKDVEAPPLFGRSQSHLQRPLFAIAYGIVERIGIGHRYVVLIVQISLLGLFALSVLGIRKILGHQDAIRSFAESMSVSGFLQWLL
jgi:hypothetical protein